MKGVTSVNVKQIFAMVIVSVGYINMGNIITFPSLLNTRGNSTLFNLYNEEMLVTHHQLDQISSLMSIGILIVCVVVSTITSRYGKKIVLCGSGISGFIAWIGIALAPNMFCLKAFRVLSGISVGLISVGGANYICEIVEPRYRGAFLSILDCFLVFGYFMTCSLGYWLSYYEISFVNASLLLVYLVGMFYLPESPTYLVMKGRMEEARGVLSELRSQTANIEKELEICYDVNVEQVKDKSVMEGLKMPESIKRILIILFLFFIRCFAGFEIFISNPSRMFTVYEGIDAELAAMIWTVTHFISLLIASLFVIDTIGRKKSMLLSIGITTVSLLALSGYHLNDQLHDVHGALELAEHSPLVNKNDIISNIGNMTKFSTNFKAMKDLKNNSDSGAFSLEKEIVPTGNIRYLNISKTHYVIGKVNSGQNAVLDLFLTHLPVALLVISVFGFSLGVATMPFILSSEYFPTWLRAEATCICYGGFTIFQYASLVSYTSVLHILTTAGFYLMCSVLCVLEVPLVVYLMPETMGKMVS